MSNEQYLADRIALQDVMLKYAAGVDERDFDLYASCFMDNVEILDFGESTINGKDNWVTFVKEALNAYGPTQHMLGPQFATIDGDEAHCRTDVQALHFFPGDAETTLIFWGTYKTDMRRVNGEWKISRHELVARGIKKS